MQNFLNLTTDMEKRATGGKPRHRHCGWDFFVHLLPCRLHLYAVTRDPHVAHMLKGLEEDRAAKMLPALCTIQLFGSEQIVAEIRRLLGPFLVAREELVIL